MKIDRSYYKGFKQLEDLPEELKLEYSKFKYGDLNLARKFAKHLFKTFQSLVHLYDTKDFIITSSPYKYIPPTAMNISKYFRDYMNEYLNNSPFPLIKTNRSTLFEGDYGKLSEDERMTLMSKDFISIDESIIQDKTIICIDDIRITGSHEKKMEQLLTNTKAKNIIFLYYLSYNAEDKDPTIEDRLNHYYVKDVDGLESMIGYNKCGINARLCKYLLSSKSKKRLLAFLKNRNYDYVRLLYHSCIGDGYDKMNLYKSNFNVIKNLYELLKIENEEEEGEILS